MTKRGLTWLICHFVRRPELTVMEMLHDSCEHCDQARIDVLKGLEMKIIELKVI